MKIEELRDLEDAKRYIAESLHFARAVPLTAPTVKDTLGFALAIVSNGEPLLPLGFLADFGHAIFGTSASGRRTELPAVPGWPMASTRTYEDFVLGKITADWSIERAADALRRYSHDERPLGLGYAIRQLRERAGLGGAELSPAVIRGLQAMTFDDVMQIGRASIATSAPHPLILEQYAEMISAFRRLPELLGSEDLVALEHRTAIAPLGQYVAHRQIVQTATQLESRMPTQRPLPRPGRFDVPTRVSDEDRYPVGGYASIGTKGSIESMLHSQLAYFEDGPQPDLFSMKYVRDELFYYTRDENQFLRPRKTLAILFDASLVESRVKDAQAPVQRIVLTLSAVVVLVRKLVEWLTDDALRIELHFPEVNGKNPLADESQLLEILLCREGGIVHIEEEPIERTKAHLDAMSRISQLHVLTVSATREAPTVDLDDVSYFQLSVTGPIPEWIDSTGDQHAGYDGYGDNVIDAWTAATMAIIKEWV